MVDGPGTHSPLDLDQIREQARQRLPVQGKVVEQLVDLIGDIATEARNQALEEAAQVAFNACLVPPDGGSPTEAEALVCEEAARRIRSLKDKEA